MMRKSKKKRSPEVVQRALDKATQQLEKADRRLARLRTLADRLSVTRDMSERARAFLGESIEEWVAEYVRDSEQDNAVADFASLGVDFLMVDEAQNFKNLWPVERREGGVPKYLGAISEASDRAMDLSMRAYLVQRANGGSGVALLSATPAKNSPLEYFTLLGFVDHNCWTRRSINDADGFIDRYLRLENRSSLKPNGTLENRASVVGFRSLPDLRLLVFRYGDFRDAKDVGLTLPVTKHTQVFIPMNEAQKEKYQYYRSRYEGLVTKRMSTKDRFEALAILAKMGMVALHSELDDGPIVGKKADGEPQRRWTWENADQATTYRSPKLDQVAALINSKPGCGHIVFVESVAVQKWLRHVLIDSGVPASRIAILNAIQAPKPLQRQEIAEAFNGQPAIYDDSGQLIQEAIAPRYDVVIANSVAYEGIDLQVRTCRIYHLDLPYEPATVQQRNGRAVRQGNMQAVIEVFYLLSEKSYDAIKLGMITGKLRWMTDILAGADKETANPAAGMDLSVEDMLLMLADDPVAAKAAMAEIQRKNEEERRRNAAGRGWTRLGTLIFLAGFAARQDSDEEERETARLKIKETADYLLAIPDAIWPWKFVVERVLAGIPTVVLDFKTEGGEGQAAEYHSRPIWEGMQLSGPGGTWAVFGGARVRGRLAFRISGSHIWRLVDEVLPDLEKWLLAAPIEGYGERLGNDDVAWRKSLVAAIGEPSILGRKALGLEFAPDYWIEAVWEEFRSGLVSALAKLEVVGPVRVGATVEYRKLSAVDDVIPPSARGYEELVSRVARGTHTFGLIQEATSEWFGRPFPRGIADPRSIVSLADREGVKDYRIEGSPQKGIGVAEVTEGNFRVFSGSGLLGPVFAGREAAKSAARWLLSTQTTDVARESLDAAEEALLRWMAAQPVLPTPSDIQDKAQALRSVIGG